MLHPQIITNRLFALLSHQAVPIFVLLVIFALQTRYLGELHSGYPNSFVDRPFCGVDALTHHERAMGLISGQYPGNKPWLFIPLYPIFLATTYQFAKIDYYLPNILQAIINLITYSSLYFIGGKLFSRAVGVLAILGLAGYAPLTYYLACFDHSLLTIPLFLLSLAFLLKFRHRRSLLWLVLAAITVTLSTLSRPTVLVLVPAVILWLFLYRTSFKRFILQSLCFGGMVVLLISPITWHNYQTTGLFIPLSKNGGVNLFTGNNPDASGLDSLAHAQSQPAVLRHIELQKRRKNGETSYSAEVFKYIQEQPGDWLALTATKTWLWFGEADTPLISPYFPLSIADSTTLRRLPFEWQAMIFTALLALFLIPGRDRQSSMLIWLLCGAFTIATIIFYIQLRFRLPFVPIVMLYAMALMVQGRYWVQKKTKRFWAVMLILLLAYPFVPHLWIFIFLFVGLSLWPAFKPDGIVRYRWLILAIWCYVILGAFWIQTQAAANDVSQNIGHYLGPRLGGKAVLGQTFKMDCQDFNYLALKMGTYDDLHDQPIILSLATGTDAQQILFSEQFEGESITDHHWQEFFFEPLPDSQDRSYFFFIASPASVPRNSLTARGYTNKPIDFYQDGHAYAGEIDRLQQIEADFAFIAMCRQSLAQKISAGMVKMGQSKLWGVNQVGFYKGVFITHGVLFIIALVGLIRKRH